MDSDDRDITTEKKAKPDDTPAPAPPLNPRLEEVIKGRFAEMEGFKEEADNIERALNEKLRIEEERKKEAVIEASKRDPVYVLKQLHMVASNPLIVKYLKEIGDLLVFKANRGYGENIIIFSAIDTSMLEKMIKSLYKTLHETKHAKLSSEDIQKKLKETKALIAEKETELAEMKNAGGAIYLYMVAENRLQRLDYYSKKSAVKNDSVAFMKVYFGQNNNYEELFHQLNSFELITEHILSNIGKGEINDKIEKLKLKIAKNSEEKKNDI